MKNIKDLKIAYVCGGGGADGGYQAEMCLYLEKHFGIRPSVIAGISTGALTAAMIAMDKTERLVELHRTVKRKDIYKKRSIFGIARRMALHKIGLGKAPMGLHDNTPLFRLIGQEMEYNRLRIPVSVGRVNLRDGLYKKVLSAESPQFEKEILASTAMPVVWSPVEMEDGNWVDGGVYNVNPLRDVLNHNPDLVIVLPTSPYPVRISQSKKLKDWIDVGIRSYELAMARRLESDYNRFLDTNRMVRRIEELGGDPRNREGRRLRSFESLILAPSAELPGFLDFSREAQRFRAKLAWDDFEEYRDGIREKLE